MKRLILLLVLLWAVPAQAAVLLSEGWEGTCAEVQARWDVGNYLAPGQPSSDGFPCGPGWYGVTKQPFFLSSSVKYAGAQSLRLNFVGNQDTDPTLGGGSSNRTYARASEIWLTFYTYMQSPFYTGGSPQAGAVVTKGIYLYMQSATTCSIASGSGFQRVACGTPGSQLQVNGWVFQYFNGRHELWMAAQGLRDAPIPYGTQNLVSNKQQYVQPENKWVCYEAHIKLNDPFQANGVYQQYATNVTDGGPTILTSEYLGRRFLDDTPTSGSMPSDSQWRSMQMYRQAGLGQLYYDQITVSTTRIGCAGGGGGPVDTTPPSTPVLTVSTTSGTSATLTWTASTDGGANSTGVAGYVIRRSTGAGTTPTSTLTTRGTSPLSYTDSTVSPGTTYGYTIAGRDAAGNTSPFSSPVQYVTPSAAPTGAFRRTLATDDFNRANSTDLGTSWDAGYTTTPAKTNLQIISNQVQHTALNGSDPKGAETYNQGSPPNDQWCQITLGTFTGADDREAGCVVRAAAPVNTDWYWCYARKTATNSPARNAAIVSHTSAGVGTNLASDFTTVWGAGDKMRCEAQGTTLRLIRIAAGTTTELTLLTVTDSQFASGRPGLLLWNNTGGTLANSTITDWAYGDWTGTADTGTFDAVSNSATGNTTNSISWSHTTGSLSNRVLAVCAQARDTVAADTVVSSMTYGGQALTLIRNDLRDDGTTRIRTTLGYLIAPPSGTNTVTITWAGALSAYGVGSATSYSGIDQASPVDAQAGGTGSGTTASAVITTVNNNAMITDCALLQAASLTVGAGQTQRANRETTGASVDSTGVSTVLKATAGAETMDWTQSLAQNWALSAASFKPGVTTPVVPPAMLTVNAGTTSATVTYNASTASIRVRWEYGSKIEQLTAFPSGVYTYPTDVSRTLTSFICFDPLDLLGVPNTALSICDGTTLPLLDVEAPIMSAAFPSSILPAGTTSRVFGFTVNKTGVTCRWSATDVAYEAMDTANQMTVGSLLASATATGLTNGSTTMRYGRCAFRDALEVERSTTSSIVITIQVDTATVDSTPPSTVENLVASSLSQSQVQLDWSAATDNVAVAGYQVFLDQTGTCTGFINSGAPVTNTHISVALQQNFTYSFVVRAIDTSSTLSAADSNCMTVTTGPTVDVTKPSTMANLRVISSAFTAAAILEWDTGTDDNGSVTSTIELMSAGCGTVIQTISNIAISSTFLNLSPSTSYCARGRHTDDAGNASLDYSNVVEFTTSAASAPVLSGPRTVVPFGVDRPAAGTRGPRP